MTVFIIFFILVILAVQFWSKKTALTGVSYDYKLSKKSVEIDEPTELISTITNETARMVPFIRMVETLPKGIQTQGKKDFIRENTFLADSLTYNSSIYLTPSSQLQRKLKLSFAKRGRYIFHGAELRGGDFLGFTDYRQNYPKEREVVVYPQPIKSAYLQQIIGGFLGDLSVRRFIMEDPILTVGTREYTGREPLKQISWKHTARTGQMVVKQFDYTTEMVVTVFLDVSVVKGKTLTPEQFECCYSLTRTVCQFLNDQKIPFEFITNTTLDGVLSLPKQSIQSLGTPHLRSILEQLGRASYGTNATYEAIIDQLSQNQDRNRSTVIITPQRDTLKGQLTQVFREKTTGSLLFIYGEDYHEPAEEVEIV